MNIQRLESIYELILRVIVMALQKFLVKTTILLVIYLDIIIKKTHLFKSELLTMTSERNLANYCKGMGMRFCTQYE